MPKAREDFPEPEIPVKATTVSRGMSTSSVRRLCSRAPRTAMCPATTSLDSKCPPTVQISGLVPGRKWHSRATSKLRVMCRTSENLRDGTLSARRRHPARLTTPLRHP